MFEDSLLEGKMKTKRGMTTVISFLLQVVLVGILILIPLIYTEALPTQQLTTFLVAPPPPPPPPPPPAAAPVVKVRRIESELNNGVLRQPTAIPKKVAVIREDDTPPSTGVVGGVGGVIGGVAGGTPGGVIGGIISSTPVAVPRVAAPKVVRVSSGVSEGLLLHRVQPTYPPLARAAHVSGTVQLQATIGRDGNIQNLRVISGHPMLAPAAVQAVKQWKYRPYLLNGEAVEVETTVTVNFNLGG